MRIAGAKSAEFPTYRIIFMNKDSGILAININDIWKDADKYLSITQTRKVTGLGL